MRKFLMMLALMVSMLAWGQSGNSLITAQANQLVAGGSASLVFSLSNEGDNQYNGFQFDLFLPGGITLVKDEANNFVCQFSDRYNDTGMSSSVRDLGNGRYRVICYSLNNVCITGHEGPLFTLTMKAPDEWVKGDMVGKLTEVVLSKVEGIADDCEVSDFNITTARTRMGDVNFDKAVNVTDVMMVVSYILGENPSPFYFKYADMNKDGVINVTDAMIMVDILLFKDTE